MFTEQKTLFNKFSDILTLGLKQSDLMLLLTQATKEHKEVENLYALMLDKFRCGANASYPNRKLNIFKYFERNFFSILFISIFITLQIPQKKRIDYGVIIHAIRTIVTCTDNILDKEQKGAVFLNFGLNSKVLDNVILLLLSQNILSQTVKSITKDDGTAVQIEKEILDSLGSIAKGENFTNAGDLDMPPSPEDIIVKVHKKIGGELLRLALIAPIINETELHRQLRNIESGVLSLGIGLQMMDDVVDFEEDIKTNKTNLLASWIVHKGCDGPVTYNELRKTVKDCQSEIKNEFEVSRKAVINSAIGRAIDGFDKFGSGGYPIDSSGAVQIIKIMFKLRGLEAKWQTSNYA